MKCLYSFLKAGFLKVMSIQVLAIVCVCVCQMSIICFTYNEGKFWNRLRNKVHFLIFKKNKFQSG